MGFVNAFTNFDTLGWHRASHNGIIWFYCIALFEQINTLVNPLIQVIGINCKRSDVISLKWHSLTIAPLLAE